MIRMPLREQVDLNDRWTFRLGRVSRKWLSATGEDGSPVDLPHCWNETDTFQYDRHAFCGHGAYRRSFSLPECRPSETKGSWRLRSEGFYGMAEVWLDGRRLARVDGQYMGFAIDLPAMIPGEHRLAVRLDNISRRNVLPGSKSPDFLLYGGLTGRVFLEWVPALHLDTSAVELVVGAEEADGIPIRLRVPAVNRGGKARSGDILWTLFDGTGNRVATAPPASFWTEPYLTGQLVETTLKISSPRHWSPEDPHLYWAEGRLEDGEISDIVRLRFGLRYAEFRPREGFFLNGLHLDLHGCNRHESIPGLGAALAPEVQRADAEWLKHLGCNFVRLSHYPQHSSFLDACDELGLLVYPEVATWKSVRSSSRWRRAARRQMRDLVLRDRHRPSVILWGMGNESRSRKAYVELREIVRELDPGRPTTYAENHLYRARRQKTVDLPDVWGTNYELDVLEEAALSSRLENVVLSECCNHPHSVKGDEHEELTQLNVLEQEWEQMAGRPYLAGYAVWCFTDYATEHRDRFRRLAGLCDAWRRPKMAAELFRARHSAEPFVALFVTNATTEKLPSRFRQEIPCDEGGPPDRELHVLTNCDSIRIDRDGVGVGPFDGAIHYVVGLGGTFEELTVSGLREGVEIEEKWRQHGPASRVVVSASQAHFGSGRTVAVDLRVVDESGVPARDWNGPVRLEVEGPARLKAYTADDAALIARGEGRTYVTCDRVETGTIT
ncbi:MAG: hypothetical protein K8R59_17610, partial [Thermoanaerobaculales bacterium]|nr:hypothetical protein [Thermoanaerobaculales bacterium]